MAAAPSVKPLARASGESSLLPAGIYWQGYSTCEECPPPVVATLLVVDSEDEARDAIARAPRDLPLGYPLVVHTDELGLRDYSVRGIAVVFGLHRSPAEGIDWLGARAAQLPNARVMVIGEEQYFEGGEGRVVVRIAAGDPVRAYARREVLHLEDQQRDEVSPERLAAQLQPLCRVEAGAFFLASQDDLEWYRWAPVRCSAEPAYVPWRATLLGWATVIPEAEGTGYRLRQVTYVECDMADIEEWIYDAETGRQQTEEQAPTALGGC